LPKRRKRGSPEAPATEPLCLADAAGGELFTELVKAWTLVERDFNGEPLLLRVLGLGEFLQDRGWRPALRRVRASTLLHRSGGGQQVVTQLWQR